MSERRAVPLVGLAILLLDRLTQKLALLAIEHTLDPDTAVCVDVHLLHQAAVIA